MDWHGGHGRFLQHDRAYALARAAIGRCRQRLERLRSGQVFSTHLARLGEWKWLCCCRLGKKCH
eukprot:2334747-Prorocentrum_lima.AAC.1